LGARIVVTSWWTPIDVWPLKRVIKALSQKGVLVVAAAWNYNTSDPFYPAAYGEVLAIWAVDKFMERASFSNYGTWVDLVAPWVDIFVPVPGNRYKTVDGTSEAAPLVAWVLAAAASLEVRVSSIIVPRSKIAAAVSADMEWQLGKGVIQFPADVCVETQSIKDNQNNQETEKSDDKNARDEQTPGSATQIWTSPLDILLRWTAGPSVYHGAASVWSSISSVLMWWVSGVCTILAVALGGRFWYKKKNKKTYKLE
jgi:subtilisin family serine protease